MFAHPLEDQMVSLRGWRSDRCWAQCRGLRCFGLTEPQQQSEERGAMIEVAQTEQPPLAGVACPHALLGQSERNIVSTAIPATLGSLTFSEDGTLRLKKLPSARDTSEPLVAAAKDRESEQPECVPGG